MKTSLLILSLCGLSLLLGCQKNGQSAVAPPVAGQTHQGPSDGGGGDTCNGKLIESFKVNISNLPEFQDLVRPILLRMVQSKDGKAVGSPFLMTPTSKNWYFIDCKLQDIPKERKGLFLESYQMAIHTNREVYIDVTAYKAMAKEEKAKLLLHEMTMGFYLMRYQTMEEIGKMNANYNGSMSKISEWKMYRPLPYRPLDQNDHAKIRRVTSWIWENRESLTDQTFWQQIVQNDFDKRFWSTNGPESKSVKVAPQVLVRMFKRYHYGKLFPKFCAFEASTNLSQSTCQVTMESEVKDYVYYGATIKQLYFKLRIVRDSDKAVFEQDFSYPLVDGTAQIELTTTRMGPWMTAAPFAMHANRPTTNIEGAKSQVALFMLNVEDAENPEIYQIVFHTKVWYAFEEELTVEKGFRYKTTYGYSAILDEGSEVAYLENELDFNFQFEQKAKEFLRQELIGPVEEVPVTKK